MKPNGSAYVQLLCWYPVVYQRYVWKTVLKDIMKSQLVFL